MRYLPVDRLERSNIGLYDSIILSTFPFMIYRNGTRWKISLFLIYTREIIFTYQQRAEKNSQYLYFGGIEGLVRINTDIPEPNEPVGFVHRSISFLKKAHNGGR